MIVKFFVVQENEKKERSNKFLFKVNLQEPLMNRTSYPFKDKFYTVIEQRVFKKGFKNTVEAYCYEFNKPKDEENTQHSSSGYTEDDRTFECPKC